MDTSTVEKLNVAEETENSNQMNADSWCEVVSKRKGRGKNIQKNCGTKDGSGLEESLNEGMTPEKAAKPLTLPNEKENLLVAEASAGQKVSQDEEWVDVMSRRKKGYSVDKQSCLGQTDNKPLPPWRRQPHTPCQSSPTTADSGKDCIQDRFEALRPVGVQENAREKRQGKYSATAKRGAKNDRFLLPEAQVESGKDGLEDRFKVLRSEVGSEATPGSRQNKHSDAVMKAAANEDRFKVLRSERSERTERSEQPTPPETKEKDDTKNKVKSEIQSEIDASLEGTCLKQSDFDMRCRQYLHAIYEKGGRPKVREAIDVVRASALSKWRENVRNWPGYVLTLLRNFFNNLNPQSGGMSKERAPTESPQFAPMSSPQLAPKSPSFGPTLSGSLSDFSPSLRPDVSPSFRPGGQCIIAENVLAPCS